MTTTGMDSIGGNVRLCTPRRAGISAGVGSSHTAGDNARMNA